jgi:hypothetical protein
MTDDLWRAAWAAASQVMEKAFEVISEQHDLFRSGRGSRPALDLVVAPGGPLDSETARACTAAVTTLMHVRARSDRDPPSSRKPGRKREADGSPPRDRGGGRKDKRKDGRGDGRRDKGKTQRISNLLSEWKEVMCKGVSNKSDQYCIWNCLGKCKKGSECDLSHKSPPGFSKAEWLKKLE